MDCIVKNLSGIVLINVYLLGVIYKSYRQVLTSMHNSQLLLKLPILDKFRLATFHTSTTQRNYSIKTDINQFRRNESSRDLESGCTVWRRVSLKYVLFLQWGKALTFLTVKWNNIIITIEQFDNLNFFNKKYVCQKQ